MQSFLTSNGGCCHSSGVPLALYLFLVLACLFVFSLWQASHSVAAANLNVHVTASFLVSARALSLSVAFIDQFLAICGVCYTRGP